VDVAGDLSVRGHEDGQALVQGETRQDPFTRGSAHEIAQSDVVEEDEARVGHALGIARRNDDARASGRFAYAADVGSDRRLAGGIASINV